MLTLHYNNHPIPTGLDFSLRLVWSNPATHLDTIPGDAGLGIDIPVNDHSRAIFGNPQRFEKYTTASARKFPGFDVRYDGVLLQSGTLVITSATSEKYSGWLQSDVGVMGEAQREKFLPDMEWKQDVSFQNRLDFDDSVDEYNLTTIINPGFWEGKGKEKNVVIKYYDENNRLQEKEDTRSVLSEHFRENHLYLVNKQLETSIVTTGDGVVVSPFLHLRYVIEESLRMNGFYIDQNDMVEEGEMEWLSPFKNLMVYNNFNIVDITFETHPYQYSYWDDYTQTYVVAEEIVELQYTNWAVSTFNYADLLPRVSMKDFLLGLQNMLNMIFLFKPNHRVSIIDRNEILNGESFDLSSYFIGSWEMGERKNVSLKFIAKYDEDDNRFGTEFHDLSDRRHDFEDPVDDYADLALIASPRMGELRLVKNINKIYEYKWRVVTSEDILNIEDQVDSLGWEYVSSGPQPYIYGDAEEIEEIKTAISTPQLNTSLFGLPQYEALQRGNLATMRSIWNNFSLRLLQYNTILKPNGLNWDGTGGLFEQRWERWARFWATRQPIEGEFELPLNVLLYVVQNITGKFRTWQGEFVIEDIEVEIGANKIGKAKIKGYKV